MKAGMCGGIGGGICGDIVQICSAVTTNGAVGHGLAARNCVLVGEIEEVVGFVRDGEGVEVPG